jgi:hypothetical protein
MAIFQAGCQQPPRIIIAELPAAVPHGFRRNPPTAPPKRQAEPPSAQQGAPPGWVPIVHDRPWRWIVVHHSATDRGNAEVFDQMHRARGWDELGYHFVIDNGRGAGDGNVEVGTRWQKQKWGAHCGGTPDNVYNNYGIGVCLVGDFTNSPPSPGQLASLNRLLSFLTKRYAIAPECVIGHRDAPAATTTCPGDVLYRHLHGVIVPALRAGGNPAGGR